MEKQKNEHTISFKDLRQVRFLNVAVLRHIILTQRTITDLQTEIESELLSEKDLEWTQTRIKMLNGVLESNSDALDRICVHMEAHANG